MKELSIEEKAIRYDEAIEVAKNNYENIVQMDEDCTFAKEGIVNTFHRMFPELAESNDERIRKVLVGFFKNYKEQGTIGAETFNGIPTENILAWLENQGEQKFIKWSGKIGSKSANGKLKEMLDSKENPAWSEEDSAMLDNIVAWIEGKWGTLGGRIGGREKFISFLKSLKDRYTWKPSDEQMEALDDFIYAKYPNIEKHGAAVKSLYQDLKKLKVE